MKTSIWLPASSALVLILSGCTNQNDPNDPLGTGPYDAQGNYHEEWADDPTKWRKPGKRASTPADDLPMVAKNDQPPLNANPLATGSQKLPPAVVDSMPRETTRHGQEVEIASRSRSSSGSVKSKSRHTDSSDEPKKTTRSSSNNASKSHSKSTSKSHSSSKSKSKSSSTRHTVKKGDSLSSIAKKYGSSVSAIQKANGLSGTMIRDGKTLVVPKH